MRISLRKKYFLVAALVLLLGASAQLLAQSAAVPAAPIKFEVISVRPHKFAGDEPSDRRIDPGGRFTAHATSAKALLRIALGTDDERIVNEPKWMDSELFDITATTADHAEVKTTQQFQALLLSLLQERFGLKFHREQKVGPVYWLVLNKPGQTGPGLKPSTPEEKPNMSSNSNGVRAELRVANMTMNDIAAGLRRPAGRPVEDHTGVKGNFDFDIFWSPNESPESNDPSLTTVLKEQLGLKLQPEKGTTEMFVVDAVTEPAEN